jgi:tetratricopeptide (TPR) repeat protein
MSAPRAVVIPFGVPAEGRGLGLGLAALLHTCLSLDGGELGIAQLHARRNDAPDGAPPSPVEAFLPPAAWRDIAGRGEAPAGVALVLTGSFEPPLEGHGTLQLLAFDPRDGKERARIDAPLDGTRAGASLVGAFEQIGARLGGEISGLRAVRELEWDALESVLRAERCVLYDPLRGGPHDRLAAMLHLGRAIGDAPAARYPAERLASIALEAATASTLDPRLAAAAARALGRAVDDAPARVELMEALAALEVRLGHPRDAERRLNAALALAPERVRLRVLLAQALRAQGHLDAALAALQSAQAEAQDDPLLITERGTVLAARGDVPGAGAAWRQALARDSVYPPAFTSLAALALRTGDAPAGQSLVDAALGARRAHPEVLQRAAEIVLATEAEGIARASRVALLCRRVLEMIPDQAWASLALARSQAVLGEVAEARARLAAIEQNAPRSAHAAEAQVARLAIDDPATHREVERVLQAAHSASLDEVGEVAARARRVATLHASWTGWVAAAVAERRRGRWMAARGALEVALEMAPGAAVAHAELAEALLQLDDAPGALDHAERAMALEGESPRGLSLKARALEAAGRIPEACPVAARALAMDPENAGARALVQRLRRPPVVETWGARLRGIVDRWRDREV